MTRYGLQLVVAALVVVQSVSGAQGQNASTAKNPNWNKRLWPTERNATFAQLPKDPVKLFDNVYSIGFTAISPFLVTTSGGLVLIDASWPETVDQLLANIRAVGQDPAAIKYIFITHAREDHFGGAGKIKAMVPGLRVGMSALDWDDALQQIQKGTKGQEGSVSAPLDRDLVINDGDTIKVGDTTFKFYVLPGTTPGSLGIEYQVRDRGKTYRALNTGAVAMYGPAESGASYIKSIERLKMLGPWDVLLPNHPFMAQPKDLGEIERDLATRGNGPHPAVAGPAKINAFFDYALKLAHEKQELEQQRKSTQ